MEEERGEIIITLKVRTMLIMFELTHLKGIVDFICRWKEFNGGRKIRWAEKKNKYVEITTFKV